MPPSGQDEGLSDISDEEPVGRSSGPEASDRVRDAQKITGQLAQHDAELDQDQLDQNHGTDNAIGSEPQAQQMGKAGHQIEKDTPYGGGRKQRSKQGDVADQAAVGQQGGTDQGGTILMTPRPHQQQQQQPVGSLVRGLFAGGMDAFSAAESHEANGVAHLGSAGKDAPVLNSKMATGSGSIDGARNSLPKQQTAPKPNAYGLPASAAMRIAGTAPNTLPVPVRNMGSPTAGEGASAQPGKGRKDAIGLKWGQRKPRSSVGQAVVVTPEAVGKPTPVEPAIVPAGLRAAAAAAAAAETKAGPVLGKAEGRPLVATKTATPAAAAVETTSAAGSGRFAAMEDPFPYVGVGGQFNWGQMQPDAAAPDEVAHLSGHDPMAAAAAGISKQRRHVRKTAAVAAGALGDSYAGRFAAGADIAAAAAAQGISAPCHPVRKTAAVATAAAARGCDSDNPLEVLDHAGGYAAAAPGRRPKHSLQKPAAAAAAATGALSNSDDGGPAAAAGDAAAAAAAGIGGSRRPVRKAAAAAAAAAYEFDPFEGCDDAEEYDAPAQPRRRKPNPKHTSRKPAAAAAAAAEYGFDSFAGYDHARGYDALAQQRRRPQHTWHKSAAAAAAGALSDSDDGGAAAAAADTAAAGIDSPDRPVRKTPPAAAAAAAGFEFDSFEWCDEAGGYDAPAQQRRRPGRKPAAAAAAAAGVFSDSDDGGAAAAAADAAAAGIGGSRRPVRKTPAAAAAAAYDCEGFEGFGNAGEDNSPAQQRRNTSWDTPAAAAAGGYALPDHVIAAARQLNLPPDVVQESMLAEAQLKANKATCSMDSGLTPAGAGRTGGCHNHGGAECAGGHMGGSGIGSYGLGPKGSSGLGVRPAAASRTPAGYASKGVPQPRQRPQGTPGSVRPGGFGSQGGLYQPRRAPFPSSSKWGQSIKAGNLKGRAAPFVATRKKAGASKHGMAADAEQFDSAEGSWAERGWADRDEWGDGQDNPAAAAAGNGGSPDWDSDYLARAAAAAVYRNGLLHFALQVMRRQLGGSRGCGAAGTAVHLLYMLALQLWHAALSKNSKAMTSWLLCLAFSDFKHGDADGEAAEDTGSELRCWACGELVSMCGPFLVYPIIAVLAVKGIRVKGGAAGGLPLGWQSLLQQLGDSTAGQGGHTFSRRRGSAAQKAETGVPTSTLMVACNLDHSDVLAQALDPASGEVPSWYVQRGGNSRICVHGIGLEGTVLPGTSVPCTPALKHPIAEEFEQKYPEQFGPINDVIQQWIAEYEENCGYLGDNDVIIPLLHGG